MVSIKDIDKAKLLAALYNRARPQGLGFLHFSPQDMTVEEARKQLEEGYDHRKQFGEFGSKPMFFDYLNGRVMKVNLNGDKMDTWGYNRDNGEGVAEKIITSLRNEKA